LTRGESMRVRQTKSTKTRVSSVFLHTDDIHVIGPAPVDTSTAEIVKQTVLR